MIAKGEHRGWMIGLAEVPGAGWFWDCVGVWIYRKIRGGRATEFVTCNMDIVVLRESDEDPGPTFRVPFDHMINGIRLTLDKYIDGIEQR